MRSSNVIEATAEVLLKLLFEACHRYGRLFGDFVADLAPDCFLEWRKDSH
jgi:hypothetical protein